MDISGSNTAEIFECVGVLTYPDPVHNGPINKNGYPVKSYSDGPWRSPSSVQRGSAQFTAMLAGDPSTPGWAATKDAPRNKSIGVPNIPSLPISYNDALPLLKAVEYRGVCDSGDWQGGLNSITYCSGPSEGQVHLINTVEYKHTPIWNVIGHIQGKEEADHAVILGNHRDAWVYGASDPSSGTAIMLERVRTLGILLSNGWQPRRSIIIASWDAGSFDTVGSTEWVEDHKDWLAKEAVAYIDVGGVQGPHFFAEASPTLKQLIHQVTQSIVAPDTNGSQTVYDTWLTYTNGTQTTPSETPPVYYPMSSKSDVTAFLSHIGIASMHFGFLGDIGVRYSAYDSFHWIEKFGDPTFDYHATLTKIWVLITLHLANDRILPMYPQDYYDQVKQYIDDLSFTSTMDIMVHEQITDLSHGSFHKPLKKLRKRSRKFEHKREKLMRSLEPYTNRHDDQLREDVPKYLIKANKRLMYFERRVVQPRFVALMRNESFHNRFSWEFEDLLYAMRIHICTFQPMINVSEYVMDNQNLTRRRVISSTPVEMDYEALNDPVYWERYGEEGTDYTMANFYAMQLSVLKSLIVDDEVALPRFETNLYFYQFDTFMYKMADSLAENIAMLPPPLHQGDTIQADVVCMRPYMQFRPDPASYLPLMICLLIPLFWWLFTWLWSLKQAGWISRGNSQIALVLHDLTSTVRRRLGDLSYMDQFSMMIAARSVRTKLGEPKSDQDSTDPLVFGHRNDVDPKSLLRGRRKSI